MIDKLFESLTTRYNSFLMRNLLKILMWIPLLLQLAGCGNKLGSDILTPENTLAPSWVGTLQPYQTPTPSATLKPPSFVLDVPVTPMPTPTPFTHTIVKGETMLGIAIRYGITLEDLRSANPEVDPRIMSIGQVLIIPLKLDEGLDGPVALPTPVEIPIDQPRCFESEAGLECIVEIHNDRTTAFEGVKIGIGLFNDQGEILGSEIGIPALNRLLPGESIPVYVKFDSFPLENLPEQYLVSVELLASLSIESSELDRYMDVQVDSVEVEIDPLGKSALVSGRITSPAPSESIWLLAVAYDAKNQAVGLRKWKTQTDCNQESIDQDNGQDITPTPLGENICPSVNFQFYVYSLGPEIVNIQILQEAVPIR